MKFISKTLIWPMLFAGFTVFIQRVALASSVGPDYYQQFLYRDNVDDPSRPYPITTHYFLTSGLMVEIPLGGTLKLLPTIHLFLLENSTYVVVYRETVQDTSRLGFVSHGCRRIEGRWSVVGTKLLLDDWAVGEPIYSSNQNKVKITFSDPLINPAFAGIPVVYGLAPSNLGPADDGCAR